MTKEDVHPDLTEMVSPFVLKMIVDGSAKYRKAYKSYAFGLKQKIMGKWVWIMVIGVVIFVLFLWFSGYLQVSQ